MRDGWRHVSLGEVVELDLDKEKVDEDTFYRFASVASFGRGLFVRDELKGSEFSYTTLHRLRRGQFVMSRLFAWEGALAVVDEAFHGYYLSHEFPTFTPGPEIELGYLRLVTDRPSFWSALRPDGMGGRRKRVKAETFLAARVLLPPVEVQRRVVDLIVHIERTSEAACAVAQEALAVLRSMREDLLARIEPTGSVYELASIEASLVDPTLPEHRDLPHIGIDCIERATGELTGWRSASEDGVTSSKFLFTEQDVIYSKIRPELEKAAFPARTGLASADAYPLRPREGLCPEFLLQVLLSRGFVAQAVERSGRTKMPKINRRELGEIVVPTPTDQEALEIAQNLESISATRREAQRQADALSALRAGLLQVLLDGREELGPSYDQFLKVET